MRKVLLISLAAVIVAGTEMARLARAGRAAKANAEGRLRAGKANAEVRPDLS